ncbi:putative ABC bile acid transporter [Myxozyma melibiosi]|uniref:ABC bile acid transporter n=1 Tax=Myxozyma melibiosi TaxID=54550 RepID=A0ABR1F4Z3_9ASCO
MRTSLIRDVRSLTGFLALFDFLCISLLFALSLMAPVNDKPAYFEATNGMTPNPTPYSSIFTILSFGWGDAITMQSYRKPLTMADVWDLRDDMRSALLMPGYRVAKGTRSMLYGLLKYFRPSLVFGVIFSFIYAGCTFGPTVLVRQILRYLEDPEREPAHMAWLYVFLLFFFAIFNAAVSGQTLWTFRQTALRVRAVIVAELYSKALKRKIGVNAGDSKEASEAKAALKAKANEESDSKGKKVEGEEEAAAKSAPARDEQVDLGRLINLMAVDAFSIAEVVGRLNPLIRGTLMILISMVLLYDTLGPSSIAGILGMLTLLPINIKFSRTFGKIQKELLGITDKRIQKTNEILQSIKIIKFFAWEERFRSSLQEVRLQELKTLRRRFLVVSIASTIWLGFPTIITFLTFACYTLVAKHELTASVAFSSLSLFNLMKDPMDRLSEMITNVIEAKTSVERVQNFLNEEETQKYVQLRGLHRSDPSDPTIGFKNASFAWGESDTQYDFRLQNLNVVFEPEKLSVIVGPTGSGKTSLLMALLGEMHLLRGKVFLPGSSLLDQPIRDRHTGLVESVAYCAQQPWLLNDTVRENILFTNKYDEQRYNEVVKLCALLRDFEILDSGDQTFVGEKGISLSGGQKQRISLARALYSPARHLILDDCLSAVDSHTALYLYEQCITGPLMKGRTCILVSHNVALTLSQAAKVVVLENGRVVADGTPTDVVAQGVLGSDELLLASVQNSREVSRVPSATDITQLSNATTTTADKPAATKEANKTNANTASVEVQQVGMVKFRVYYSYLRSMGLVGYWIITVSILVLHQAFAITQSYWVKVWSMALASVESAGVFAASSSQLSSSSNFSTSQIFDMAPQNGVQNLMIPLLPDHPALPHLSARSADSMFTSAASTGDAKGPGFYLAIYGLIALIYITFSFLREIAFFYGSLTASKKLFDRLLECVLRATPRFFDQTPVGRIINRFSKDIESIDREVAVDALGLIHSTLSVIVIIGVISVIMPVFLLVGSVVSAIFFFINLLYLQASRELKRMESVTRSPIYQHFGETLVGVSTIRAYGYEQKFIADSMGKVDTNMRPTWLMWGLNRWMSLRTDLAGGLISFFAGTFVMLAHKSIDSGLAGLILSYAITFTQNMFWVVFLYSSNEMNMNSVERIDEFLQIEQEAADIVEDSRPPHNWPSTGAIEVTDLTLRYAPGLPRVIKGISFSVDPCSKIGVVGRTGAGKSTIASAFFRFLEAETGKIVIDGIDISKIGLRDLRQSLTIIPQDPTLFTGTVRSNLDPFDNFTDREVFTSLKQVHLIADIPGEEEAESSTQAQLSEQEREARDMNVFYRLDSPVTEGGGNLSQGQRQLMCLARSLLRSPKIIFLDEATASIDYNTDAQIQETIREEFSDTTILTIAHRLRSVIDYDKILVLDAGMIKEYDSPHALLQIPDSIFRSMCESSGELEALEVLAKQAYDAKLQQQQQQQQQE